MEIPPGLNQKETSMNASTTLGVNSDEVVDKGKYYYKADRIKHYFIQDPQEVDTLYAEGAVPRLQDLVNTCVQSGYAMTGEDGSSSQLFYSESENSYVPNTFHKGDWVEVLGNDMVWDLQQISLVTLQANDDWDYVKSEGEDPPIELMEVYYNIGKKGLVPQSEVRAPKDGLKALFGGRPFLWQQHCLLQLERRIRFQKDHEHDFEEIDVQLFAERRFEEWLSAVGNEDFLEHYEAQGLLTRYLLKKYLFAPFELMDEIVEDPQRWDFEDKDITIYTYFGLMGSGGITVFLTVCIQVLALGTLIINSTREYNGEPNPRFFVQPDGSIEGIYLFGLIPDTNYTTFCNNQGSVEGKILIAVVLGMYFIQVVPNTWRQFFKTSGSSDTTYSRINSLRRIVWDQCEDTFLQQIGYKLDKHMNIGFTTLVYWSMLFLLFNTPHPLDIVLNALAIEFIHQFDERLADSEWWDPANRYIRAGVIEVVLRGVLDLNAFRDRHRLCETYDIDLLEYEAVIGTGSLYNAELGLKDDQSTQYMSKNERLWNLFAKHARETKNSRALRTFEHYPAQYGTIEFVLFSLGLQRTGIFNRYVAYRTWSRWEKILYLPILPKAPTLSEIGDQSINFDRRDCCGFGDEVVERGYIMEFVMHIVRVLMFREVSAAAANSCSYGKYYQIPWKVVDGLVEWLSYVLVLLFPVYVLTGLSLVPYCY